MKSVDITRFDEANPSPTLYEDISKMMSMMYQSVSPVDRYVAVVEKKKKQEREQLEGKKFDKMSEE